MEKQEKYNVEESFIRLVIYEFLSNRVYMTRDQLIQIICRVLHSSKESEINKVLNLMADSKQITSLGAPEKVYQPKGQIRLTQYGFDCYSPRSIKVKRYLVSNWIAISALIISILSLSFSFIN